MRRCLISLKNQNKHGSEERERRKSVKDDVKTQEPKRYSIFWELEEEVGKILVPVISAEFHDILSRGFQVAFRSMPQ